MAPTDLDWPNSGTAERVMSSASRAEVTLLEGGGGWDDDLDISTSLDEWILSLTPICSTYSVIIQLVASY